MKILPALFTGLLVLFLSSSYIQAQTVKAGSNGAVRVLLENQETGEFQNVEVPPNEEFSVPEGFALLEVQGPASIDFGNGMTVVSTNPETTINFFTNPESGEVGVQVQGTGDVEVSAVAPDGTLQSQVVSAGSDNNFVAVDTSTGGVSVPAPTPVNLVAGAPAPATPPVLSPDEVIEDEGEDDIDIEDSVQVTNPIDNNTTYFAP